MNTRSTSKGTLGVTLVEALVIVAVFAVWLAMVLPALSRGHAHGSKIRCIDNLKQIGTACRIWEEDHGKTFSPDTTTSAAQCFEAMQTELGHSPAMLVCPQDKDRSVSTNFAHFSNANLSYFMGLNISESNPNPNLLLSGDRNLTNGTRLDGGLLKLTANDLAGWGGGLHSSGPNAAGNVLLSDGSVQQVGTPGLRQILKTPGVAPVVLAVP